MSLRAALSGSAKGRSVANFIGTLRREFFAGIPRGIFPRGPIAQIAPFLKVGLRPLRQERSLCALECFRSAGLAFARMIAV
jgi:hypothetical protein